MWRPLVKILVPGLLLLCSCNSGSEEFDCGSAASTSCALRPGKSYLGLRLGMSKREAFTAVCGDAVLSTLSNPRFRGGRAPPASNRFVLMNGPVRCEYVEKAEHFDYWNFNSRSAVCWGPADQTMSVEFENGKLSRLVIGCGTFDF